MLSSELARLAAAGDVEGVRVLYAALGELLLASPSPGRGDAALEHPDLGRESDDGKEAGATVHHLGEHRRRRAP